MILIAGQQGIVSIKNAHTGTNRDMMIVNNGVSLTGPVSLAGNVIELGYNEIITMQDNTDAVDMITLIDSALA